MSLVITVAGVHRYTVRIPNRAIIDQMGDELDGMCIETRRLILLSPTLPAELREEALRHEVQHAWENHVPAPRDAEERAQLAATIDQSFRADIERQGDLAALYDLQPEAISLPYSPPPARKSAPVATPQQDRWECQCGAVTMCGSIQNGEVEFHEGLQRHQVQRWFRCECCDGLMVWTEVATVDGQPTGVLVQSPAPTRLFGAEAAKWERERLSLALR